MHTELIFIYVVYNPSVQIFGLVHVHIAKNLQLNFMVCNEKFKKYEFEDEQEIRDNDKFRRSCLTKPTIGKFILLNSLRSIQLQNHFFYVFQSEILLDRFQFFLQN